MIICIFAPVHRLKKLVNVFVTGRCFLLNDHQGKTAKPCNKVIWNKCSMICRQVWIGGICFVPLFTLCMRFYEKGILITAHHGRKVESDTLEQDWNASLAPWNTTICLSASIKPLHELVYVIVCGTCSTSCPPRQNSQTRRQSDFTPASSTSETTIDWFDCSFPLYTLCSRFYTSFSQEHILITAH